MSSPGQPSTDVRRKLTTAYKQAKRINFRMLYALIFAFTTGIHLYGDQERQLRQLETGRDMTKLLGGQEREDEVGQPILGYWYTFKLISKLDSTLLN